MVMSWDIRINFLALNLRSALATWPWASHFAFKLYMFSLWNEEEYLSCKLFCGVKCDHICQGCSKMAGILLVSCWETLLSGLICKPSKRSLKTELGMPSTRTLPRNMVPGSIPLGSSFSLNEEQKKSSPAGIQQAFTLDLRVKQRSNCLFIGMFLSPPFNVKPFHLLQSFRSQVSQNLC